jgi:HAD superfamily hydrolase (TIGR01509 family)
MIRALIFDFDGTILDTELPEFQSWQEIYTAHGCELPFATWAIGIGTTNSEFDPYNFLETQYGQAIDREQIRLRYRERFAELIKLQTVLPGVENYLEEAKQLGLKIGLASSSSQEWVRGHLGRLDLEHYFDCLKCADDVKLTKPDPELYLAALTALEVEPEEALALEDSPNGITAAKRAGIFCIAIPNPMTGQLSLDHADLKLTSLAELSLQELIQKAQAI